MAAAALLAGELVALRVLTSDGGVESIADFAFDFFEEPTCLSLTAESGNGAQSAVLDVAVRDQPPSSYMRIDEALAFVRIYRGETGKARVTIAVLSGDFGLLAPMAVELSLFGPAGAPLLLHLPTRRAQEPDWIIDGLELPVGGKWVVFVEIQTADAKRMHLQGAIDIPI